MGIRAIVTTLAYKVQQDVEQDVYKNYVAQCLRILTENSAVVATYYSGEGAPYMSCDYTDIVNTEPVKQYNEGEVAEKIKSKLR